MQKLLAILTLLRRGNAVADPALLGNRAALGGAIAALLSSALAVAAAFGRPLDVDYETLQVIGFGLAAAVSVVHTWLHAASSPDVGLPDRPGNRTIPDADAGRNDPPTPPDISP